jgi:hypothetical protein
LKKIKNQKARKNWKIAKIGEIGKAFGEIGKELKLRQKFKMDEKID